MNRRKALLALHLGALLFGLSGIFGKLALAAPIVIVFGRALFAVAALALFTQRGAAQVRPNWQRCLALAGAGLLLGGHWWSFFVAIKVAGVAVATLGFASFPAFTVLLEGLLFKERVSRGEWAVVGLVCLGLVLVTPHFDFGSEATLGLAWAVLSGLLFAMVSVSNRATTRGLHPAVLVVWRLKAFAGALVGTAPLVGVGALAGQVTGAAAALAVVGVRNGCCGGVDLALGSGRSAFFFNDTATTKIYTILNTRSLHDALPI